jgi:pyridoxal phosphate enzyme (YggS family)
MSAYESPTPTDEAAAQRLAAVQQRIDHAQAASGRPTGSVKLLAVSKKFPIEAVDRIAACGQQAFGENYAQEGVDKAIARPYLVWHFIGPIQSNKTRGIAEHFSWVHTIDRLKIAERLSAQRPEGMAPLQVCIQVNVSGEASKSGCQPDDALALCTAVTQLPNLKLRGLMAIPKATHDKETQHQQFAKLRELQIQINQHGFSLDTLSMGMSDDLEAAISEGATLVRVGSAIFGQRTYTESHGVHS